ncbi:MAG: hypothetical protein FWD14_01805 [Treponema sp.]|nr:hypothetical protein [Treponema sp.]
MVFDSKLTVFAGLNGSGKTTIAVMLLFSWENRKKIDLAVFYWPIWTL